MVPERPSSVPVDAVWMDDQEMWEVVARDGAGLKIDGVRRFRADGTLYLSAGYVADALSGPFTIFHPGSCANGP